MKIQPTREAALAFLAWIDFHARSRFARSTIPEEKWGTTRSLLSQKPREERVTSSTKSLKPHGINRRDELN